MRPWRRDHLDTAIAQIDLANARRPTFPQTVKALHHFQRFGNNRRVGSSGKLHEPLILRNILTRRQRDGERNLATAPRLPPARDDGVDGFPQWIMARLCRRTAVDQQRAYVTE